jgi:hypothetical protein
LLPNITCPINAGHSYADAKNAIAQVLRKYYFLKHFVKYFLKKIFFFSRLHSVWKHAMVLLKQDYLAPANHPGVRFFKEDSLKSPNKSR